VPVRGRPGQESAPDRGRVDAGHRHHDLVQPAVHGPSGVEPAAHRYRAGRPGHVTLGHKSVQRWNLPDGWVISNRPAHPALVSEDDFIAAQDVNASRGPVPQGEPVLRRYLLAGLLACGLCGRRMESAWSNGKPAYRCRHGRTSAMGPDPARPKNTYVREDKVVPHLAALHLLLTSPAVRARRRTRSGADVRSTASPGQVIGYLREHEITLTWDPAAAAVQARATETAKTVTVKAS
jgi:site-specific DNA recombinase